MYMMTHVQSLTSSDLGPLTPHHSIFTTEEKEELYGTRHQEAVKIFNALLSQENLADPIKQVQSVIQKCFDIQDLQSEVRRTPLIIEIQNLHEGAT